MRTQQREIMDKQRQNAIAVNAIADTNGYKVIVETIKEMRESFIFSISSPTNANDKGTLAFLGGGINTLDSLLAQLKACENFSLVNEDDIKEP